MSITDELRKYVKTSCQNVVGNSRCSGMKKILAIADRIDAAHERELRESYDSGYASADDWLAQHEDAMAEHGWVKLPVDADGVPIHVGDEMEWPTTGETFEVVGIGDGTLFYVDGGGDECADWTGASTKRHHRAPTVEDVLREFADDVYADSPNVLRDRDAIVERYVAKLRLAGEDE